MICAQCHKEFQKTQRSQFKYCSKECRQLGNKPNPKFTKIPDFDRRIKEGLKLCNKCDQEKPLTEFRNRGKGEKRSYGDCKECERLYDYNRRRKKGIKVLVLKKDKPLVIVIGKKGNEWSTMRWARTRPLKERPIHTHTCKECSVVFNGYSHQKFCCRTHSERYYRRVVKSARRAKIKATQVETIDPIKVFEKHHWHCANCNIHTPRHLKGKRRDNTPELDHKIPLSKGGTHTYNNVQLLCRKCNNLKSDNILGQYSQLTLAYSNTTREGTSRVYDKSSRNPASANFCSENRI